MSNALEVVRSEATPQQQMPQVFYGMGDLEKMATAVAQSGLFGMKTKEQAMALMLVAQAEGEHPATITQDYDIIQGRPARKTHSVLARFQKAGGRVQWTELSATRCAGIFSHPHGGSVEIEWTIDMARTAKLADKDNWKGYPRAMLRARCIAEGVRAVFPAAIGGMLIREEAEDLPLVTIEGERIVEQPKSKSAKRESAQPEQAQADPAPQDQEQPKAATAPATPGALTAGMLKTVRARLQAANEAVGLTESRVCEHFKVERLEDIPAASVNDVLGFITNPA